MAQYRTLIISSLFALGFAEAEAQDATSAYLFSNVTTQGTARSMGFGNALGSVGGDFSVTSVNPAGLGIYRSSELTITPSMRANTAESIYLGQSTSDNNVRLNFNNFGIVATDAPKGKRYERRSWKAVTFAFGMNRVADFNRNYSYGGVNSTSSATQAFESDANQYPNDPVSTTALSVPGYLGYQTYLLNTNSNGDYYSAVPFTGGINQEKTVQERGRINEYTISLGGNYKEQLMLGATIGIPSVKYSVNSTYSESIAATNNNANPSLFNSFRYSQALDIKGVGFNMKVGAIYKLNNSFRVGAALHSPSVYALNETYTPSILSDVGGVVYERTVGNGGTVGNNFDYSLITPWRSILSATYIMKGKGFITADYEYANYGFTQFTYPVDDGYGGNYELEESAMNKSIKQLYKSTSSFRVGAEILLTKVFMARAGFGHYGNPYKSSSTNNGQRTDISGGVGFRSNGFFADIAFVHSAYKAENAPYYIDYNYVVSSGVAQTPMASTDFSMNNVAMTIGVKF